MNFSFLMLVLSVLAQVSSTTAPSALNTNIDTPQCRAWVDSVYNSLSETDRIAQLMVPHVVPNAKSRATVTTMVEKYHVGGLLYTKGTATEFAECTNHAQRLSRIPLMITLDGEWGPSMRVTDAPRFPYNMGLGAIRDLTLLYRYGQEVARECRALGIQVDFAPVLDVNSNPGNPVIGKRSFGEDPHRVAASGRAFSLGLEAGGVMAVGKHFPGHGDTNTDSHKALPTITHTYEQLDSVDLLPFKAFIEANCSGIMVGHLSVPALDASKRQASMSQKITTGLLRERLGFNGLIFTDGLGMKGAALNENLCVAALMAGADMLLCPLNVGQDIEAVRSAVRSGKIAPSVIEERCKRVLAYKYALGLSAVTPVDTRNITRELNSPEAEVLNQDLANAEVTVLRNTDNILPLADLAHNKIAIVNIGEGKDNEFANYCRRYATVDVFTSKSLQPRDIMKLNSYDVVVAAVYNDDAASVQLLGSLKKAKALVPVFMINAYEVNKFASQTAAAKAVMLLYGNSAYTQRAAAMGLFGGIDVDGTLPVNLPGVGRLGEGVTYAKWRLGYTTPYAKGLSANLTARIDSTVNKAMKAGAFPGAQVLVVKDGDVIIDRSYGLTTKGGVPVTFETLYDLASVSKTVGTLPGVMKAYDLGLFDLDKPACTYVPGLDTPEKRDVTPRMLLYHETGIPAALNMFNVMMDTATYTGRVVSGKRDATHNIYINGGGYGHDTAKMRRDITSPVRTEAFDIETAKGIFVGPSTYDTIMATIYRTPVDMTRKYRYSCLNFCLLMDLEQHVTGQPHQQWVTDSVWARLGAGTFCYRPLERYGLERIAATEQDTYLRKQHMHGYVHDELADFSGGVQGNAGVFGTATDIAKLCQMWLNGGVYGDARILSEATSRLFTTSKSPTCHRGLGFDKPNLAKPENSSTCDEAGAAVYGHTGFTGTCFWVDPDEDLIFIFLSNRVDPSRSNKAFSESAIRPTLMSMIYKELGR